MNPANDLSPRGPWARWSAFIGVGTAAAAVHWLVAMLFVRAGLALPLVANVLGWALAFGVSATGHRVLTFGDRRAAAISSSLMFLAVSLTSLAFNELVLWLLLSGGLGYGVALVAAMLAAALLTYVMSSRWAFRTYQRQTR